VLKKFQQIVEDFAASWQAGQPQSISELINPFADSERQELLARLLPIDIDHRRRAGEAVAADDYQALGIKAAELAGELLRQNEPDATIDITSDKQSRHDGEFSASPPKPREATSRSRRIGPYKLLQQIGEGGMGTVWLAEQEQPVRRRVAIKLVRSDVGSKDALARFAAERQALAMMDHNNIAKVFDAGTTESGSPYFVMELVKGIPITEYCDKNRLSVAERLELMVSVCRAVQHAHQKGIIHRDLKPSNVLVTLHDGKPIPKVIDFGLAKALEQQTKLTDKTMFTHFGQVVGTVQYMSPEQAEMDELDVDTRTDIYSLGVMIYELLTGSTPLDRATLGQQALLQVLQIIRESEPPRPSARLSSSTNAITGISQQRKISPAQLQQILRGELDWVVMKALEKDRTRRYETASSLGDDIQNYLNGDAVEARPPSLSYRFAKSVRKNRGLFAATGIIALLLCTGLVVATALWRNANQLADEKEYEAGKAREAEKTQKNLAMEAAKARTAESRLRIESQAETARIQLAKGLELANAMGLVG